MNKEELKHVLGDHYLWLKGEGGKRANLCDANLRGANLRGANLCDANLRGANLWGVAGNRNEIRSVFVSEIYPITYTATHLQIGCQRHDIDAWWEFEDKQILKMDGETALKFWRENKEFIRMTIEKFPATPSKNGDDD